MPQPSPQRYCLHWMAATFSLLCFAPASADPIIMRNTADAEKGEKSFSYVLLKTALEYTLETYGPYELRYADKPMTRKRTYQEMHSGGITIADSAVTDISAAHLRVPIPVARGILSYRLFFVRAEDKDLLKQVRTLSDLREFSTGAASQWMSTQLLLNSDFDVVQGPNKKALMNMLDAGRFDTYGRGLNEIFYEHSLYAQLKNNITIDSHIALYFYLPTYFHVTRLRPKLAERIHQGLLKMNIDGEHERIFLKFHQQVIEKAGLEKRRILILEKNHAQFYEDYEYLYFPPGINLNTQEK